MKRPFLALWISYMLGIYLYHNYQIDLGSYIMPLLVSGSFFVASRLIFNRKGYIFLLAFSLFLGGYLYGGDYKLETLEAGEVKDLEGIVIEEKNREEDYERYVVRLTARGYKKKNRLIVLTLYENTEISVGDRLLMAGDALEFRENTNPKLFNQRNYYKSQYIHNGVISKRQDIYILGQDQLGWLEKVSYDFARRVERVIDSRIGQEHRGLLKSMILGKSSYMGSEELSTFRELGLGHMIAVSGLHIGILYGAIMFALNRVLNFHKRIAELASLSIIWCYIVLIGSPVSSVRAGLMISAYLLGKLLIRRADAINIISVVGFSMIVYRPLWLLSVGYVLSFAGIMVIAVAISGRRNPMTSVILGLAPLNVYYFNLIPVISILSNLLLAPILSLVLVLGMAMVGLSYILPGAVEIVATVVNKLLHVSGTCLETVSDIYKIIHMRSPEAYEVVLAYVVIGVIIGAIDLRWFDRTVLKCFLGYTIAVALLLSIYPKSDLVEVDFLDVGQGDCAVIRFSDKTYLVDSGGSLFSQYDVGERVVYPYLLKHGLTNIDAFIVSHFHADHVKGFLHFADRVGVEEIIVGHRAEGQELYSQLLVISEENKIPIRVLENDSLYTVDSNNKMYFMPPSQLVQGLKDENNNSLLLLLESFGKKILFTGDMERERESDIKDRVFLSDIDVLKVPHHGSPTSSTEEFLNLTRPRYGVIQVGRNMYGHPSSEVLKRYESLGTELYRNDISGMIKLSISEDVYEIEEYLKKKETPLQAILNLKLEISLVALQVSLWLVILEDYRKYRELEDLYELQRVFKNNGWG